MSHLFFIDESGHDLKIMPYEVRGGIVLHAGKLWRFIQAMMNLEQACFGDRLSNHGVEIKGHRLLDKDRFKWAAQSDPIRDTVRRERVLSFLRKGRTKTVITREEFTAYGQACIKMAHGIFDLLHANEARIFAAVIPRNPDRPEISGTDQFLRKDLVFLFERYFHFLEGEKEIGLIVMDETEKEQDRRFIKRMEGYFTHTDNGRYRATRIVPNPFFVASDLTYPVQAADVAIYCINWGYRICYGMNEPVRTDMQNEFERWLQRLQFQGDYTDSFGTVHNLYGITYVPDPFTPRRK